MQNNVLNTNQKNQIKFKTRKIERATTHLQYSVDNVNERASTSFKSPIK